MKKNLIILGAILVLVLVSFLIYKKLYHFGKTSQSSNTQNLNTQNSDTQNSSTQTSKIVYPIADFKARITKKPFGIYITPQNSPVSPERFSGYHTGTDIEYQDITTDVPVYAINDGVITLARTASGYGGVIILETEINGQKHSILYGHIRPSSLSKVGSQVKKGEQIGLLGTEYSTETDDERRHLHFAVLSDNRIDLKGYVPNQSELSGWIDPVSLY